MNKLDKQLIEIFKRDYFKVGDMVEINECEGIVLGSVNICTNRILVTLAYECAFEENVKDLKLIQPEVTLPMILRAIAGARVPETYVIDVTGEIWSYIVEDYVMKWEYTGIDWVLQKDNKDCNLWEQSDETKQFIYEVIRDKE